MGKDCDFCKTKDTGIPVYIHRQQSRLIWLGLKQQDTICPICAEKKIRERIEHDSRDFRQKS
jgi:hypothetical protein